MVTLRRDAVKRGVGGEARGIGVLPMAVGMNELKKAVANRFAAFGFRERVPFTACGSFTASPPFFGTPTGKARATTGRRTGC